MFLRVVTMLFTIACLDYAWQRYNHKQGLRMSKSEVKQEQKQSEADPKVRQRVRRAYREFSGNKMLAAASGADVVVTNPTHFAVALRYDATEMGAPRVVAKGAGELALRIKEIARKNGVPLVERRALARALYRTVKVGDEIPSAMYRAVAEILAYIYALQAQRAV
jgi:flagellar biosynthetic protein FlhB